MHFVLKWFALGDDQASHRKSIQRFITKSSCLEFFFKVQRKLQGWFMCGLRSALC